MAEKQAFVYIVDVGKSMNQHNSGRKESDLDFGMRYIWDKITATMAASRKTFCLGVIGFKTDGTENNLSHEESYHHISIFQPIVGPFEFPDLKKLQNRIKASNTDVGDAISAIAIAIDMIDAFTKKLKYQRKIVLMTNGKGYIDADDTDDIASKLNELGIELVIVGIDFDDLEYGFKEEEKDPQKADNEALMRSFSEKCNKNMFGTMAEAIDGLSIPSIKETKPYKTYFGQLTLGDPGKYDSAMCIDVERYFRTHKHTPPSASNFVIRTDTMADETTQSTHTIQGDDDVTMTGPGNGEGGLTAVKQARTYKVSDATVPGGKRDVDRDDLAMGYEYGRTAVYISESDKNVTNLETTPGFSIVGFIPQDKYDRFFNMGETGCTVAQKTNDKARMALSSLIHALFELDSYAVARIVVKEGKEPQLILLAPSIEPGLECLLDVPLPFAEDVRQYRFPPLDRVITTSGTTLTTHRNIPTASLSQAMSAYVDSMDLSAADTDEDGNDIEYMTIEESYSPMLHRLNQAIRTRAVKANDPIAPPAEVLIKYSSPPRDVVAAAKSSLDSLIAAANVKKVTPKAKGKRGRDNIKPLSGLDVESLLGGEKRQKVTSENAIPDFKQMVGMADSLETVQDATKQMSIIIRSLITHSMGDSNYGQAIACLRVMKEELIALEDPALYNDFLRDLKEQLLSGTLGGERRDFMAELVNIRLGLITKDKSELSDVTDAEANQFYSMRSKLDHGEK